MKKFIQNLALFSLLVISLSSCGYVFLSLVAPNSCKKCEIMDGGTVILSEEDCGGGVFNMEQRMKAEAHDMGMNFYVECESYKAEE